MATETGKQTGIVVKLVGEDGNAFAIIGRVSRALESAGLRAEAAEFQQKAFACGSYDELLQLVMATVEVE